MNISIINKFIETHKCELINYEETQTFKNQLKKNNIFNFKIDYDTIYLNKPKISIKFRLKLKNGCKRRYLKVFFYSFTDKNFEFIENWLPQKNDDLQKETLIIQREINLVKEQFYCNNYFAIFISDKQMPKRGVVKNETLTNLLVISTIRNKQDKVNDTDKQSINSTDSSEVKKLKKKPAEVEAQGQFNTDQDTKDNYELLVDDDSTQIEPVETEDALEKELASVNGILDDLKHSELSTNDAGKGITYTSFDELKDINDELERVKSINDNLQNKIDNNKSLISTLENDKTKLQERIKTLTVNFECKNSENKELHIDKEALQREKVSLQNAMDSLNIDIGILTANIKKLLKFFSNIIPINNRNNLLESLKLKSFSTDALNNYIDEKTQKALIPNIPDFINDFQMFLTNLRKPLTIIFEEMESFSPFSAYFKRMLYGNNNNAGIKNAIDVIGLHEDRSRLAKCFGLVPNTVLKNVSPETFFNGYIKPIFFPILNEIDKLYSYMQIEPDSFNVKKDCSDAKIDVNRFEDVYIFMSKYLLKKYKIEITKVNLFKDKFESDMHEMTEYNRPEFTTLKKEYKEHQNKLSPNIIFDLVSPGIKSEKYNFSQKPVVIVNV